MISSFEIFKTTGSPVTLSLSVCSATPTEHTETILQRNSWSNSSRLKSAVPLRSTAVVGKMAESSIPVSKEEFSCAVCLYLLEDPVSIPCGHNYCKKCISDYWNKNKQRGIYSCPQCRETFSPRPVLNKNTLVAEMVEKLKNTKPEAGDVKCDFCAGTKQQAVKSCPECQKSYCQDHLEEHEKLHSRKGAARQPDMICPEHGKVLNVNGVDDQQAVCHRCKLKEIHREYQQGIQKRQKALQEIRSGVESYKRSAQTAVEDCVMIFTELISYFEKSRSELSQQIRDQEKAAVSRAEGVLKTLKEEIDDLKRRDAFLEQISQTDDHSQSFPSLTVLPESPDLDVDVSSLLSFDDVKNSVSHLSEKLQLFCREKFEMLSVQVKYTETGSSPEPNTRELLLQYSQELTLDPNTLNGRLRLSEGNRCIKYTTGARRYPDHLNRFDAFLQVLGIESMYERSYWEVEWIGKVGISVSYQSIRRKGRGKECEFGHNDQSWSLICSESSYSFWHNDVETKLPVGSRSSRIGVYVDHSEGILSFYSISETRETTLIHRIQTTFSKPLYPGFRLLDYLNSNVTLCGPTM